MKKVYLLTTISLLMVFIACKNNTTDDKTKEADSLQKEVVEGHNIGMAKDRLVTQTKKEAERLLDSISKLPAKAQEAAKPLQAKLKSLVNDLDKAHDDMEKWMEGFHLDSAKDNLEQRIKYLADEKIKVGKIKETIVNSLQKADSIIKSKF